MSTLSITLPEELRAIIDEQVATGRFSSPSEYIGSLIRQDQRRLTREDLARKLLSRLRGRTVVMDVNDWKGIRQDFLRPLQATPKSSSL